MTDAHADLWYATKWFLLLPVVGWGIFALAWMIELGFDALDWAGA